MTDTVDLAWAVQKGCYAVASPAVTPVQMVDGLPTEGNLPDRLVYFGDDEVQQLGGKGARLERHALSIHVFVQGSSRKPMRDLQEMVRAALENQPIACDGAILSPPQLESSGGQQVDPSTFVGTQVWIIFAQPAA